MMPQGSEFCTECGAPLADKPGSEGSDTEIYPELARANLLRMRAEYDQATKICLSLLRRYPNNATANTLLGDIAAEKGDLEQAAEWYELALDIIPDSPADRAKLENVKQRMAEREAATTAEQLGLPSQKTPIALYGAIVIGICVVAIITAFVVGQRSGKTASNSPTVNKPLVITDSGEPNTSTSTQTNTTTTNIPPTVEPPPASFIADPALYQAVLTKTGFTADYVLLAEVDPRSRHIRILYKVADGADGRLEGAKLAAAAMEHSTEAPRVQLHGIRQGQIVFDKAATREGLNTTATPEWQSQNQGNETALADALFGPVAAANPETSTPAPATTGGTTG